MRLDYLTGGIAGLILAALAGPAFAQTSCELLQAAIDADSLPAEFAEEADEIAEVIAAADQDECGEVLEEAGLETGESAAGGQCERVADLLAAGDMPEAFLADADEIMEVVEAGDDEQCGEVLEEIASES